jgi:hypothetical protein
MNTRIQRRIQKAAREIEPEENRDKERTETFPDERDFVSGETNVGESAIGRIVST